MTDQRDTHQRYRGGGREVHDRWNRADHYGPRTTHGEDRTTTGGYERRQATGKPVDTGQPTGRGYPERAQQPLRRYGSQRGRPPQGTTPGYDRSSAGERPPAGPGEVPHASRERRPARASPGRIEIPAGSRQSPEGRSTEETPQTGRQRRPERASGPGRQSFDRGRRQQRWAGRSMGQGWQEAMREGQVEHRRSTAEHRQERREFESDVETGAGESEESDEDLEQPRDPKTGRFLPKDEAERDE